MSDAYVQIANFKWGLDGRRSELLEAPGALLQCQNAFINAGGEIEQRKGFVQKANQFPTTTFGLEATASGIVTFGSVANPGTLPSCTANAGGVVLYRQCVHPTGFKTGKAAANMTNVLSSCNFQGKAFVVASFDDGYSYCYYGDVSPMPLVQQIRRDGTVLYIGTGSGTEAISDLATDLTAILNTIQGFTATANVDQNGSTINGDVTLTTTPSLHTGFSPTVVSTAGQLSSTLIDQDNPGVGFSSGTASFWVTAAPSGTIKIEAPQGSGSPTPTIDLMVNGGGTLAATGTAAGTASAIVSLINARTSVTGYSAAVGATPNNDKVTVFAPQSWGALANAFNLTVTVTGALTVSSFAAPFGVTIDPNPAILPLHGAVNLVVTANVTGLVGNPSFVWSAVSVNYPTVLVIVDNNSNTTTISRNQDGLQLFGTFRCAVKDGGTGLTATVDFTASYG